MPAVLFSEALDARVLWANHQIAFLVDSEQADANGVYCAVRRLGWKAFPTEGVPLMLADVPQLVTWFEEGWESAAESHEMQMCRNCQDGTGNPCSIHG
ncbi:hypothetical protein [Ralstonia pseudosolanacearum]|uniref:hypothetical protein n=1 Tax=Ralstonia pseudosolanacearum TaxID=1310165 RepID=UPI003CEE6F27